MQQLAESYRSESVFLPAILSGLLLWAGFFPINQGWLGWLALVPWLFLVRSSVRPRRLYFATWIGALAFTLPALQWLRVAHPMMYFTWIGLALYCSLYFLLGMYLIRRLDRKGVPLWLSVPTIWTALEYVRTHFPTGFDWMEPLGIYHLIGFGWYYLGYTQHDYLPIIQIADLTGVYGLSFVLVMTNVVIYQWICWFRKMVPQERLVVPSVINVVLITSIVVYGFRQLDHPPFDTGPKVALLQASIPQELKNKRGSELMEPYMTLWSHVLFDGDTFPDLTIWPETSCIDDFISRRESNGQIQHMGLFDAQGKDGYIQGSLNARWLGLEVICGSMMRQTSLMQKFRSGYVNPTLFGLNALEIETKDIVWKYNSAVLYDQGHPTARYDKMHLVPFGEYVPLRQWFPWLQVFTPYKNDYSCKPGEQWTRFKLSTKSGVYHFGCLICYEDTDPSLARQQIARHDLDFLVNISNDGWFRGTEEHEQHLAICRFRAIETRRSVVRAVNMGISAIIDPDGRVVQIPGKDWATSKRCEAIVQGTVPIDHRSSLYPSLGDWVPQSCGLMFVILLLWPKRK